MLAFQNSDCRVNTMFKPIWTRALRHTSGDTRQRRPVARMRPVRLHAEHLEDRLLMAANSIVGGGLAPTVSRAIDQQVTAVAAQTAATSVADTTSSTQPAD